MDLRSPPILGVAFGPRRPHGMGIHQALAKALQGKTPEKVELCGFSVLPSLYLSHVGNYLPGFSSLLAQCWATITCIYARESSATICLLLISRFQRRWSGTNVSTPGDTRSHSQCMKAITILAASQSRNAIHPIMRAATDVPPRINPPTFATSARRPPGRTETIWSIVASLSVDTAAVATPERCRGVRGHCH